MVNHGENHSENISHLLSCRIFPHLCKGLQKGNSVTWNFQPKIFVRGSFTSMNHMMNPKKHSVCICLQGHCPRPFPPLLSNPIPPLPQVGLIISAMSSCARWRADASTLRCRNVRRCWGRFTQPWRRTVSPMCGSVVPWIIIWGFPEMGVPPSHPFIDGFSVINHPAIGAPPFMETPISAKLFALTYPSWLANVSRTSP